MSGDRVVCINGYWGNVDADKFTRLPQVHKIYHVREVCSFFCASCGCEHNYYGLVGFAANEYFGVLHFRPVQDDERKIAAGMSAILEAAAKVTLPPKIKATPEEVQKLVRKIDYR